MYKSVHGGDIYSEQNNSLGKNIVDYSANVNPLGLPVSVKEAIKNSIKNCVNLSRSFMQGTNREIS